MLMFYISGIMPLPWAEKRNGNDTRTKNFSPRRWFGRLSVLGCCRAPLRALTGSLGLVAVPQHKEVQECSQGDPDLLVKPKVNTAVLWN